MLRRHLGEEGARVTRWGDSGSFVVGAVVGAVIRLPSAPSSAAIRVTFAGRDNTPPDHADVPHGSGFGVLHHTLWLRPRKTSVIRPTAGGHTDSTRVIS